MPTKLEASNSEVIVDAQEEVHVEIDIEKLNKMRFTDWSITTPIMLLVLVLAFLYNTKGGSMPFGKFLLILLFYLFVLKYI